jgi:hypothetical protein
MGQIQNAEIGIEPPPTTVTGGLENARRAPLLQAKGSCWYCDRPVDNVRRFCSIACRDDYFEEEWNNIGNPDG